jgi:hypothetical protein
MLFSLVMGMVYWLVPYLLVEILSCITDSVKYGFCLCEFYVFCCKREGSIQYISGRMKDEKISKLRHLFRYVWSLFIFFGLFISVCICHALIMFKLENRVVTPNIEDVKISSIDFNGIEKYLWIAFAIVSLLVLIVVTLILLLCKGEKFKYKFQLDQEHIKAALLSERPFFKLTDCFDNVNCFHTFEDKTCGCLRVLTSILIEIIMPLVSIALSILLLALLAVFSFYVWCLNTNQFYKFLLLWYAKITFNIFSNVINAIRNFTNCTWLYLIATKNDKRFNDENPFMRHKQASKLYVFFKYVLCKNIVNCIEIAFFDMSSIFFIFKFGN